MRKVPDFHINDKRYDTYNTIGWHALLYANLLLFPICYWYDYPLIDILICFAAGIFGSYVFNVIRSILSVKEEYTFYHFYFAAGISVWLAGWLLGSPLFLLGDVFALYMAIIAAIGRIGCFHAGCCYGKQGRKSHHRYPTQLMESVFNWINFSFGLCLLSSESTNGVVFALLTANFALARYLFEWLRGDERRTFLHLSETQWIAWGISGMLLVLASVYFQSLKGMLLFINLLISASTLFVWIKKIVFRKESNKIQRAKMN